MPQANITYDTRYNRDLVSRLDQMEDKWLNHNRYQYHPSPMGYRMGSFHGERSAEPAIHRLYGGGAPAKYITNGTSPAYPPLLMRSGMEVSSGGAAHAGVDGAVGGNFWDGFKKGFSSVLKVASAPLSLVAPELGLPMGALGQAIGSGKRGAALMGGNFLDTLGTIATHALPLLLAAGRPVKAADKRAAVEHGLLKGGFSAADLGMSVKAAAKKLAPEAMKIMLAEGKKLYGKGFNFGKFLKNTASSAASALLPVVQDIAIKKASDYISGKGRKKRVVGGLSLSDVIASAKTMGSNALRQGKEFAKTTAKREVRKLADKGVAFLEKKISGAGAGRGRGVRAEIVKKVMKDRGISMIAASKAVKAEGLY